MKRDQIRNQVVGHEPSQGKTRNVSAFGAEFVLHKLTYRELQEARAGGLRGGEFDSTRHLLAIVVLSAKDEDGVPVFEKQDLELLLSSDAPEMDRLVQAALELNNLTEKAHDEGKETSPATTAGGAS